MNKQDKHMSILKKMVNIAILLALFVVMLGAYTRLTNAGLGCPDWPGCYGKLVLPQKQQALLKVQTLFPQAPIETRKAWTEMAHRYAAGTLALLILCIAGLSIKFRQNCKVVALPIALVGLTVFQALLGMWTVTLKLLPIVVMGHLLGGMLIFSGLFCLRCILTNKHAESLQTYRPWLILAVGVVLFQIALGGWVSANYAGISCIGFPTCNGSWLPHMNFHDGFYLFSSIGANYQGGLLDNDARAAIQMVHRIGAITTLIYLLILMPFIIKSGRESLSRTLATAAVLLVLLQFTLGILNVIYLLPLKVAVLHNGTAAVLLASVFALAVMSFRRCTNDN